MLKGILRVLLVVAVLSSFALSVAAAPAPQGGAKLELITSGSAQKGTTVGYAFVVNNPSADRSVEGSEYQIAAYDKEGGVLATDSGYIDLVLPKQKLGMAGELMLPSDGLTVDSVEVQVRPGPFGDPDDRLPLASDKAVFAVDTIDQQRVTAVVRNPNKQALTDIRVSVIAYDKAGEIIGAGFTYASFIPGATAPAPAAKPGAATAKATPTKAPLSKATPASKDAGAKEVPGETGVNVMVTSAGKPAKVEVYAGATGLTETPKPLADLVLGASGFGQKGNEVGWGAMLENTNKKLALGDTRLRAVAYAKDGTVLGTSEETVYRIGPGQKTGVAGSMFMAVPGAKPASVAIQVLAGDTTGPDEDGALTADKAKYLKGDFMSQVTGVVKSTYKGSVTNLTVHALAYDKAGKIIGGGSGYLDFVGAAGQAPVEVSVVTNAAPAKVELYPRLTTISEVQ